MEKYRTSWEELARERERNVELTRGKSKLRFELTVFLAYSVCDGDLYRWTTLCASLSKWNVTTICNTNSSFSNYTWFAANNDRTQIGSPSVFTNLCLFSSLPPSLLCLLCSFPPFSSFCLFSHLIFSRPYTSLTEVSACRRRGWFAQQCRNENFFCCQNQSHILQSSY